MNLQEPLHYLWSCRLGGCQTPRELANATLMYNQVVLAVVNLYIGVFGVTSDVYRSHPARCSGDIKISHLLQLKLKMDTH